MNAQRLVTCAFGLAAAVACVTSAHADALYALSSDGTLYKMNVTSGAATPVRAQLPTPYQSCDSVEFLDGWFYASYGGGKIVRFGFSCGDEIDLGPSGLPWVEGIARRADGTLVVSASQNNDVGAESIAVLNPATGDLSNVVASSNQAVLWDMDAIAFAPNGTLYAINLSTPRVLASIDPTTGAVGPALPVAGAYAAMAWSERGTLYALDIQTGSCSITTTLVTINPTTGAATSIGPTDLVCVAALTFGPAAPAPGADFNDDGAVNAADLGILLGAWGPCGAGCCVADLDRSGDVDAADLGLLLGAWAP